MLEPGTRLGAYAVVAPLGSGGMGEVYLAEDARLGRKAAIKVLPTHFAHVDERVRRFEQEAVAASKLNHPNIVTVYDIGEAGGHRFIAMEYVAGRTLRSFCASRVRLETLLGWGVQMARALDAAHRAGIVHRDIKPENVIVREDGYVKLLDFGIARLTAGDDEGVASATMLATSPGGLLGTLPYMAPERLAGRPATPASDMFAMGLVIYELATGQHPFGADNVLRVVQALASEPTIAPSRIVPELPEAFDALVLRLLEKDEHARPDAGAVARALDAMQQGVGLPASTAPALTTSRAVTVGRDRERRGLLDALAAAEAGKGSLIGVAGEPGIGKTTLVEDVLADSTTAGSRRVLRGRCSERLAGTDAYLPWLEALDSWRRDGRGEAALQAMRRIAPTWYALIAHDEGASDSTLLAEIRTASQDRLKRELVLFLQELTRHAPLTLFFDDIHWADTSTIDLLAFVATRITEMRLLIVLTYRPTDLQLAKHPFLRIRPDLQARGVYRELMLGFLTEPDIASFLARDYPDHGFPAAFAALLHARTEGNPLFMVDLTRDLRSRGVIAREAERWQLARPLSDVEREWPESVRGMIERKISQVSDADRQILVAAAVQGYQFDATNVARALELDQGVVEDSLESLERVHAMVLCLGDEELPDRSLTLRYRFVHVLYQEELYRSLRSTRRVALSRAVAQSMRLAYGDQVDRVAPALATLFETARDFESAGEFFLHAARRATLVFANHEAIALARRGLSVSRQLPDAPRRARLERDLHIALGWPLNNVRGYAAAEVEETYTCARERHGQTGDSVEPYQALWGLAMVYLVRAQYQRVRTLGDEILRLATMTGDSGARVTAHYMLGTVLFYLGDLNASREHYLQGIALNDADPTLSLPDGRDLGVAYRAQLGRVLWLLGYPDQAEAMTSTALDRARRADQPLALAFALFLDTLRRQLDRDLPGTRYCSEELRALAAEHDLVQYRTWAEIVHGWSTAAEDAHAAAVEMRSKLAEYDRLGSELSRPHFLTLLAEVLGMDGRFDEGLAVIDDALACIERTDERYYLPEVLRVRGELQTRSDDPAARSQAGQALDAAIQEAERQQARAWELRAVLSLVTSNAADTKIADARARLTEVFRTWTEGFERADVCQARAVLDGPDPPTPSPTPSN